MKTHNNNFENIRKQLGFEEVHPIKVNNKSGEYIARGILRRRDVLLKIICKEIKQRIDSLKKEIVVDKIISKHNDNIENDFISVVDVISSGENKSYSWIVRKYYSGGSLSDYYPKGRPLLGYDVIRRIYFSKRKIVIPQIIDNINAIQEMTKDFRKLNINKRDNTRRFPEDIKLRNIVKISEYLGVNTDNVYDFYEKNKKRYFSDSNIKATTSDLVPANIIVKNDNKVLFSDFEWFCFDNYTVDVAFLWLFFWRYKGWRKTLIERMITNDDDRFNFRMSIIRQIYYWYDHALTKRSESLANKKNKFYSKHKWTKYLVAAGESFEALMKVK